MEDYELAITDFESTFSIDDSYFDAILNIAKCYELLKNKELALSTYDRLLSVEPSRADAAYNQGIVLFTKGL